MTRPTRDALLAAGLFLGTLALYAGPRGAGFVHFDDPDYVSANPIVQRGLTLGDFVWALTTDHAGNWFPLTWVSHMLDVSLFGLDPRGHHATSVVLHALSAVLLFDLLRRGSGSVWRSALFPEHRAVLRRRVGASRRERVRPEGQYGAGRRGLRRTRRDDAATGSCVARRRAAVRACNGRGSRQRTGAAASRQRAGGRESTAGSRRRIS